MAINSKQARRIADDTRKRLFVDYMNRLISLYHNSVTVLNADDLPKRYLLKVLLEKGGIAYDIKTKLYLPFVKSQIDVYGLPKAYQLIGFNGFNVWRKPDEVVILRASDNTYPIYNYFEIQVNKIIDIDMSIMQNLEANKTMSFATVPNQETLLSLVNVVESRRIGSTIVYVDKNMNISESLKAVNTGAVYLVDKLLEARKEIINETLSVIGINVANVDKRERVQNGEINASNSYAMDCISVLIDTFNHDAEEGNLTIRLEGNTTLIEDRELEGENEDDRIFTQSTEQ